MKVKNDIDFKSINAALDWVIKLLSEDDNFKVIEYKDKCEYITNRIKELKSRTKG